MALSLAACGTRPWVKYPCATPPDQSCQTGVEAGDVIYIWKCLNGTHIVVVQSTTVFSGSDPIREVAACGQRTPYEEEHMAPGFICLPGMKWETAQGTR